MNTPKFALDESTQKGSWFNVVNEADSGRVQIYIHGYIGAWDIRATDLISQVNAIDNVQTIEAHINSYGGEVFEGIAIYNWLRNHRATVETVIDSVAASIASVIFLAGTKRTVSDTSMAMIHLPMGFAMGNSDQMRKEADDLDAIDKGTIRKAYKQAVGDNLSDDDIDSMMRDETWLDSEELIEYGFATDSVHADDDEEAVSNKYRAAAGNRSIDSFNFEAAPGLVLAAFGINSNKKKHVNNLKIQNVARADNQAAAQNPTEEELMDAKNREDQQPVIDEKRVAENAVKAERARITAIRDAASMAGVDGEIVDKMINEDKTVNEAIAEFKAAKNLAASQPQNPSAVPTDVTIVRDDADKFREGASISIAMACGLPVTDEEKKNRVKSELPSSLHGLMRTSLIRDGMSANRVSNMTSEDLARESIVRARNAVGTGTGDLTNVLADTINKALGVGYQQAAVTWPSWVKVVPVNDFKTFTLAKLSLFSDMDTIPEGAPFRQGGISDKKETGSVSVKGKSLNVSFQALTNDDLGSLARIPALAGNAYNMHQNRAVYDYLYGSGAGPTLTEQDSGGGTDMFTSNRGNYVTGANAPSKSSFNTARAAMRQFSAPKGKNSDTAVRLNIIPRFVIAPAALETSIETLVSSQYDPATAGSLNYNPFGPNGRTPLMPVIDGYIDGLTTTGWWMASDQNQMETIIMLALNGQVQPNVRSEESRVGEALGINYDVYGAFGVMAGDWRGMYFSVGA